MTKSDLRSGNDVRDRLTLICTKSESTFAAALEEERSDVDGIDDDLKLRSGCEVHTRDADLKLQTATVNFKLCKAGREDSVEHRT